MVAPKVETQVESVAQYVDEFDEATAMRMMKSHLQMAAALRKGGAGRWEVPEKYRHMVAKGADGRTAYRFVRLGTLSDLRSRDAILRNAALLEAMGWKKAPASTRNALYLTDSELGVYYCIAEAVGKVLDEHEHLTRMQVRQRRFGKSAKGLTEDMAGIGGEGMAIERLDVEQRTMSLGEFAKMR